MWLPLIFFQWPTSFEGSPVFSLSVVLVLLINLQVSIRVQLGDSGSDLFKVAHHLSVELLVLLWMPRSDIGHLAHVVGQIKQHWNVGLIVEMQ